MTFKDLKLKVSRIDKLFFVGANFNTLKILMMVHPGSKKRCERGTPMSKKNDKTGENRNSGSEKEKEKERVEQERDRLRDKMKLKEIVRKRETKRD